jgi:F1/F0 ATPase, Methanosarcina type, subunit 2
MDIPASHVLIALAAGAAMGGLFFGGLLVTVRRIPRARHPQRMVLGSFVLRTAVVLGGFAGLVALGWHGPCLALLSFIVTRVAVMRLALRRRPDPGAGA